MKMSKISNTQLTAFIAFVAVIQFSQAMPQRPSFAGLRPSGISQKDKYHINNNNSAADIGNRFGTVEQNSLPFGATQKPPAPYVGVVFPQSNFSPLAVPTRSPNEIGNRFGSGGNEVPVNTVANSSAGVVNATQRVPIDAHNDPDLVNILSRLPEDQRPFWFLNAAAIEAQRNGSFVNFAGAMDSRGSFFG